MPVAAREAEALAAELARLGAYFEVTSRPDGEALAPPWRPMSELVDGGPALRERVDVVRSVLAERAGLAPSRIEARVAASVAQLGLVARFVSPYLGAAVLTGPARQTPSLDDAWWQPATGGAFPLCLPVDGLLGDAAADAAADGERAADALRDGLVDGPVAQLVATVQDAFDLSSHVLWGNVGSAVNAVAVVVGATRPDLAHRTDDLVLRVLDHPLLRVPGAGIGTAYRRRSCCLIYRAGAQRAATTSGVCGDCVLVAARARGAGR